MIMKNSKNKQNILVNSARQVLFGTIILIGLTESTLAHSNSCYGPLIDPLVGAWNGTFSVPALGYTGPVNFTFHAGGTLNGQGVQCIGVPITAPNGTLFTVDTGEWQRTSYYKYKIMYSDIGAAPTAIVDGAQGVFPTTAIGRTGTFGTATLSSDCKTVTLTGKIGVYGTNDPTLITPLQGPFDMTLVLKQVQFK